MKICIAIVLLILLAVTPLAHSGISRVLSVSSAAIAEVALYADSAGVAGATRFLNVDDDTVYVGGEQVRIPAESEFDDTQAKGTMKEGRLAVLAKKESPCNYGLVIYAHRDSASYPSRLINLVANQSTGGTTNGFTDSFIAQRIKVNIECDGVNPAQGLTILNNAGQNMWGLFIDQPQADSAIATNIYSRIQNLVADADGKTANNIYADGGHIKFLDGDTEIESLYVDLDHTVIVSDTVELGGMLYVPAKDDWPGPLVTTASQGRLNMLHSSYGLPNAGPGIVIVGDTTYDNINARYMLALKQPPVDSKQMASSKFISIEASETTNLGAVRGLDINWAANVTGYPIHIDCDNTDTNTHVNIYSIIANDNGASWNIYADGGKNYFSKSVEIADTLKLTSNKVCGKTTLVAGAGGAGDDSIQVTTDIAKANTAKAHIFLQEYGSWSGFARVRTVWDGGFTIESNADEASDREVHWFIICDP